jgi:hypothetical protein
MSTHDRFCRVEVIYRFAAITIYFLTLIFRTKHFISKTIKEIVVFLYTFKRSLTNRLTFNYNGDPIQQRVE